MLGHAYSTPWYTLLIWLTKTERTTLPALLALKYSNTKKPASIGKPALYYTFLTFLTSGAFIFAVDVASNR